MTPFTPTPTSARIRLLAMLLVPVLLLAVAPFTGEARAESASFADPSGDAINQETQEPADEPRADILEHQMDFTDDLVTLRVLVAQPSNPASDPAWQQRTRVGWVIDVGDEGATRFVDYQLDADGVLSVVVNDISDREPTPGDVCDGQASGSFDGTAFVASVPATCLDAEEELSARAEMLYQPSPDVGTARDVAPDDFNFDGPIRRTDTDPSTPDPAVTDRTDGASRIETAVLASQREFAEGAERAYLARADEFADAVSGGTLTGGPILLVPSCGEVPTIVLDEIDRLSLDEVVALGGEQAICEQVLADASTNRDGATGRRIAGPDRFATSAAISQEQSDLLTSDVYLASADGLADAVAGGVITSGPILLVPSCGPIPQVITDELERVGAQTVYALGGEAAICEQVLADAQAASPATLSSERIAGPTRIDTAVAVSQHEFDSGADVVYLARADVLADAVSAGGLTGGPVLLVPSCGELPQVVADEIVRLAPQEAVALGGQTAVCDALLAEAGRLVASA